MSLANGSAWDIELTLPDSTVLGLMLDVPDDYKEGDDLVLDSALSAVSSDTPISERLASRVQEDWSGGVGISYNVGPCIETRIPGYALPAGNSVSVQVTLASGSTTPIVAMVEYAGDLFFAQQGSGTINTGRVMRSTGGTGTGGGAPANSLNLPANEYMRDLLVADNGSGTTVLFASSSDVDGTNGRLHRWNGTTWTSTTRGSEFGTKGRGRMALQYMVDSANGAGWRIVVITGPKTIAYTLAGADPMQASATSWVEDVIIDTPGSLVEIVAARRKFWLTDSYGTLFELDELAHSSSLTSYGTTAQAGNGTSGLYLDGYVYLSQGRAYRRVRVGDGATLNEFPGNCAPGWNTRARSPLLRGYPTAACHDQGGISLAIYNPTTQKSAVYWGVPREIVNVDTPNPLVWHGPLYVWSADYRVTRMMVASPTSTGDLRLWVAAQSVAGGTATLTWFYLPISGSSLDDIVTGGLMRFATGTGSHAAAFTQPSCQLEMLPDTWDDKASKKILYQIDVGSEGPLDANTKLTLQARADPAPASTSYTSLGDVTASPTQAVTLPSVTSGQKTQLRVDFFAPSGWDPAQTPVVPVLDSLRALAWKAVPSIRVVNLPVRYGDGLVPDERSSERDPDAITSRLETATGGTTVTYRTRTGKRWTAKLEQVMNIHESLHDGGTWGKTVHARLQIDILAALAS